MSFLTARGPSAPISPAWSR